VSTSVRHSYPDIFNGIDLSGAKILIVEDDKGAGNTLMLLLQRFGAVPLLTRSVSEALVAIHTQIFDVILLDFQMPRLTGFNFMEILRLHPDPAVSNTFVIAITTQVDDKDRILASGCNMYFSKPTNPPEFLKSLTKVIEELKNGAIANRVI